MSKNVLSTLAALLVIILGVWGIVAVLENNDDDSSSSSDDTSISADDENDDMDDQESDEDSDEDGEVSEAPQITDLLGVKEGNASLLLSSLMFPDATMTTNEDLSFTLEAGGLSLALLGNPDLAIDGNYPMVMVDAGGTVEVAPTNPVLNVTTLTPSFFVSGPEGEEINLTAEQTEGIVAGLASAGIVIPEITPDAPAQIPVELSANSDGNPVLTSTADAPLYARFEVTK